MKNTVTLPSAETLRKIFDYNPETGILTWKERPREQFKRDLEWKRFNKKWIGKTAGIETFRKNGDRAYIYLKFSVSGVKFFVGSHRVILAMEGISMNGLLVDHRDGDTFNNIRSNIRAATPSQNCCNRKNIKHRTHQLPKGVAKANAGKYHAQCMVDGVTHRLGRFSTPEEAHAAYCKFAAVAHGEFHHGGK